MFSQIYFLTVAFFLLEIQQTNLILVFSCHSCLKVSGSWEWRWIFKVNCVLHLPPALESEPKDARHMKLNHYTIYYLNFLALESLFWLLTERGPSRDGFYVISLMLEWGGSQWMPSFSIHRFITNNQHCSRFVIRKKTWKIQRRIFLFLLKWF